MTLQGTKTKHVFDWFDEMGIIRVTRYADVCFAKCDNKRCFNFTTVHDLAGSWCCTECFHEAEENYKDRPTRIEQLQMMLDYQWDLDEHQQNEIAILGLYPKDEEIRKGIPEKIPEKNEFSGCTDSELESKWQSSADMIGMYAMKSWNCPPEEETKWRDEAEKMQERQQVIQNEITRRGR